MDEMIHVDLELPAELYKKAEAMAAIVEKDVAEIAVRLLDWFLNGSGKMDVTTMTTEELEQILRDDASKGKGTGLPWEQLEPVLAELARRKRAAHPELKTAEKAYREFQKHYMPEGE